MFVCLLTSSPPWPPPPGRSCQGQWARGNFPLLCTGDTWHKNTLKKIKMKYCPLTWCCWTGCPAQWGQHSEDRRRQSIWSRLKKECFYFLVKRFYKVSCQQKPIIGDNKEIFYKKCCVRECESEKTKYNAWFSSFNTNLVSSCDKRILLMHNILYYI